MGGFLCCLQNDSLDNRKEGRRPGSSGRLMGDRLGLLGLLGEIAHYRARVSDERVMRWCARFIGDR